MCRAACLFFIIARGSRGIVRNDRVCGISGMREVDIISSVPAAAGVPRRCDAGGSFESFIVLDLDLERSFNCFSG